MEGGLAQVTLVIDVNVSPLYQSLNENNLNIWPLEVTILFVCCQKEVNVKKLDLFPLPANKSNHKLSTRVTL